MHKPVDNLRVSGLLSGLCLMLLFSACSSSSDGDAQPARVSRDIASRELDGKALYERHCRVCHSMAPPPAVAPPVRGVAFHYREAFDTREAAEAHMVDFIKRPDSKKAICDPEAIERFGLMPAMTLPDDELRAVSAWFWDQYDPAMRDMHRQRSMGGRHGAVDIENGG
ncbi:MULTISPECIES: c-type cytochrome [unclassified Prosthecochloris]|uniref:c-type cytochrome n=1 Tax=unclassified Prosthecochloris TaxID=2632826 RepID=UPI001FC9EDCF|nr:MULTISPECIES: c-type cytochrome [unclassified Prosthecochloris]